MTDFKPDQPSFLFFIGITTFLLIMFGLSLIPMPPKSDKSQPVTIKEWDVLIENQKKIDFLLRENRKILLELLKDDIKQERQEKGED